MVRHQPPSRRHRQRRLEAFLGSSSQGKIPATPLALSHRIGRSPEERLREQDAPDHDGEGEPTAGTLDVRDGKVLWVGAEKKNSGLFIQMLERLDEHYADAKLIHVILDNCAVHRSSETCTALGRMPRIRLHFLPPYCPDHNRIERLWQDLHANVTRNHRHRALVSLCAAVASWLDAASPWPSSKRAAEPKPRGLAAQRSASRLPAKPSQRGAQPAQQGDDGLALAA